MDLQSTISLYAGGPGSGCRGENCGRKISDRVFYHGTNNSSASKIQRNGFIPRGEGAWEATGVSLSEDPKLAKEYAELKGKMVNESPAVLKVKINQTARGFYANNDFWSGNSKDKEAIKIYDQMRKQGVNPESDSLISMKPHAQAMKSLGYDYWYSNSQIGNGELADKEGLDKPMKELRIFNPKILKVVK